MQKMDKRGLGGIAGFYSGTNGQGVKPYSGQSNLSQALEQNILRAEKDGLPPVAGVANTLLRYQGDDVVKRVPEVAARQKAGSYENSQTPLGYEPTVAAKVPWTVPAENGGVKSNFVPAAMSALKHGLGYSVEPDAPPPVASAANQQNRANPLEEATRRIINEPTKVVNRGLEPGITRQMVQRPATPLGGGEPKSASLPAGVNQWQVGKADPEGEKARDARVATANRQALADAQSYNGGEQPSTLTMPMSNQEPGRRQIITLLHGLLTMPMSNQEPGSGWTANADRTLSTTLNDKVAKSQTYDEQVAAANKFNAMQERNAALQMSAREKAALETAQNRNFGAFIRGGAAAELGNYNARRDAYLTQEKNNQAKDLSQMQVDTERYKADRQLLGQQANADAHTRSARLNADAHKYTADRNAEAIGLKSKAEASTAQQKADRDAAKATKEAATSYLKSMKGVALSPANIEKAIAYQASTERFAEQFGKFAHGMGFTNPSDPRLEQWRKIATHAASEKPWDASMGIPKEDYMQAIRTLRGRGVDPSLIKAPVFDRDPNRDRDIVPE